MAAIKRPRVLGTLLVLVLFLCPAVAEDTGDNFSNNLFSDLAPLLALFGEQVAKQYVTVHDACRSSLIWHS
jgi:hypothetical protein